MVSLKKEVIITIITNIIANIIKNEEVLNWIMIGAMKRLIKWFFNSIGYDIVRVEKNPRISLLGLRNIPIRTVIDGGANMGQFARMSAS
jgi:hypothetical protein